MIGKIVTVTVDRAMGTYHPKQRDMYYPINYGFIEGIMAPDGEEKDAYILGVEYPVKEFTGKVIAIIHRKDDIEEKWVVAPIDKTFSKEEIIKLVQFQEQYFNSEVVMEYININNKEYKLVIGDGKDDKYRASFNALTEKTFWFNFELWYQNGYWNNQYIPYSLMDGDEVVSNVSVNLMNINVFGKAKRLIQLGTVMTCEEYRNQGLLRVILNRVIADWQAECDFIYLFANDSVLNFYPKFGFKKISQYQCTKTINKKDKVNYAKKLNMSEECDKKLVYDKANASSPYAKISMIGNGELIMFYCISFMKDNVYYIPKYETVVVANYEHDTLEVFGVFGTEEVSLDIILDYMVNEKIQRVKLYFTPKEMDSYTVTPLDGQDTLFILGEDTDLLANKEFMFPLLSHT